MELQIKHSRQEKSTLEQQPILGDWLDGEYGVINSAMSQVEAVVSKDPERGALALLRNLFSFIGPLRRVKQPT